MIPASFFHCFDTGRHVIDIDVFFSFSLFPTVCLLEEVVVVVVMVARVRQTSIKIHVLYVLYDADADQQLLFFLFDTLNIKIYQLIHPRLPKMRFARLVRFQVTE